MATQKLGKPDQPEELSEYQRKRLAAEWVALDNQQRKLRRDADSKTARMKEIAGQLEAQLRLDGVELVELPRHEFGFELAPGYFSYRNSLVGEVGLEEVERRKDAVPQVQKLFVREKQKPAKKAAKAKPTKKKAAKKATRRK